ncbi:MAG: alpha/beta fold hydrolase [Beijerinckiaceae bacterium]
MPFSESNGVKIYYETAGQGPPLVFIHANPFDRRLWLYQVARFSQRFTTINVDIRGYGFSDKPTTPFTLEDMAADVASVMERESVERAVIVGCSVGSGIALLFGLDRPGMTEGLVLVGGSSRGGGNIQKRIDGYTSGDLAGYRRQHMRELFAPGFPETPHGRWVLNLFDENSHTLSGESIAQIFRARAACNMTPRLAAIDAPTLVINGAHDGSLDAGRDTAAGIAGAGHVVIPGTGHACSIEDPWSFDAAMIDFLRGIGRWS